MQRLNGLTGPWTRLRREGLEGSEGSKGSEGKDCPAGNDYEVSVTGIAFCCINRAEHSAELATDVATPYPAAPDSPLFRGGVNSASLCLPVESCGTMASIHSAPSSAGRKVVPYGTKGGAAFPRAAGAVVKVLS